MYKMKGFAVLMVLAGCATSATGSVNTQLPTVSAPAPQAPQQAQAEYKITVPGNGWVQLEVTEKPGVPTPKAMLQHQTGKKADGLIIIRTLPEDSGTPEELAAKAREADKKKGIVTTAVSCDKETPHRLCSYGAKTRSKQGLIAGKMAFKLTPETGETTTFTGFWPIKVGAERLKTFDAMVDSLSVKK